MAQELPPEVFLSYSSTDRQTARNLQRLLSDAGVRVWFDEVNIVPGTRWETELRDAMASAEVVLMLVGGHPPEQWQSFEFRSVLERASSDARFRVVPVLLQGSNI